MNFLFNKIFWQKTTAWKLIPSHRQHLEMGTEAQLMIKLLTLK
jgi:hypothetical protein